GGFQMTEQELAVIAQEKMEILICIIDNSSLGIIKQWQEMNYRESYEVNLQNPDFIELAKAYGINGRLLNAPDEVYSAVKKALSMKGPYILDIKVDKEEGIILPKVISKD
ncbi:MAG: thiamine pyrophosphate-dependent enzyme, partial [Methanobacterium sp.]